jgi:hypothetical protein
MDDQNQVPVSYREAVDLLRKWMDENRVIHLSITDQDDTLVKMVGRIDRVGSDIHFSQTKSTSPLGQYTLTAFPLTDSHFEYCHAEHAPEILKEKLGDYDALLYVYRRRVAIGFAVLPVGEGTEF